MTSFIGVDVGGTKSAAVLVDQTGTTIARHWFEHRGTAATPLGDIVLDSIDGVLATAESSRDGVVSYAVAVAGLISSDQSTVVHAAKLRVRDVDLGAELSSRLDRPVLVENDANATLFGHRHHGRSTTHCAVASTEVVLLLTLGTGVGGSIMIGDRMVIGANGFAAELGHVTVDYDDKRLCLCGSRGCLENFSCGRGVEELAAISPPPSATRRLLNISVGQRISSRHIVQLAERGDPWAIRLLELSGTMLGRGLSILCTTLDPTSIIIGGSFGHAAAQWLVAAARIEMSQRWPFAEDRRLPNITVDAIGPYAAATGAALMAMTTAYDESE